MSVLISKYSFAGEGVININIGVTVLGKPCVINNNDIISVDFGNIPSLVIDKEQAEFVLLKYSLDCNESVEDVLEMTINGTPASFEDNNSTLQTSIADLGIFMTANGNLVTLNKPFQFNVKNKPELMAKLVKKKGGTLTYGDFTASGSISVNYP